MACLVTGIARSGHGRSCRRAARPEVNRDSFQVIVGRPRECRKSGGMNVRCHGSHGSSHIIARHDPLATRCSRAPGSHPYDKPRKFSCSSADRTEYHSLPASVRAISLRVPLPPRQSSPLSTYRALKRLRKNDFSRLLSKRFLQSCQSQLPENRPDPQIYTGLCKLQKLSRNSK